MILIVEDDEHKSSQIVEILNNTDLINQDMKIVDNVRDAVISLTQSIPSKIVLDMSLPSHKALPGQGTPVPLPTGGIEVLFELMQNGLTDLPILILTQYPEIEIEEEPIPVEESAEAFKYEYGFTKIEACYYDHIHSEKWKKVTTKFLR
ncbi:hypothetical protein C9J03_04910 [Photobacterium gaetbulicola]|uniref:response regulator n=1 Tax=Photobacterium gaetbulicola TaxID=1295392 RepID=UPI0005CBD24A|nr:response regulator [Photobacterium gaetbulicola]PSU13770.1 hypothetical protein C9J03_04910 [Photobacterium gaetbulicola]